MKYSHYTLNQVQESGLLSTDRMEEVLVEIDRRVLPCLLQDGRSVPDARVADMGDKLQIFVHLEHDHNWEYLKRCLIPVVLTDDEMGLINQHCLAATSANRDKAAFEKAQKVPAAQWEEGVFWGDDYFPSVGELLDRISDDGEGRPEFVWAAHPQRVICGLGVSDLVEDILVDRGWEDMEVDDLHGVKELEQAIANFTEANSAVYSYREDRTIAILLPPKTVSES